jgi:hypothetical protein
MKIKPPWWTSPFGMRPFHFDNIRPHHGVKEKNKSCELEFSISKKMTVAIATYVAWSETVTATYIHKALEKIHRGFWA